MSSADRQYLRILEAVGQNADGLGDRHIAAHWPFVGSDYRGLVIAGQALMGWDADKTPARWRACEAATAEGRERLLAGAKAWASGRDEPMGEVLRWGHRSRSPFWGLSRRVIERLEPQGSGPWFSRYCWWNVYPLGWDDHDESPTGVLKDVQTPIVGDLFWAVMESVDAKRVLLVSGKDWWWNVRSLLGLEGLSLGDKPIIAAGQKHGLTLVATYHPGAHIKGLTRDRFADAVVEAFRNAESA